MPRCLILTATICCALVMCCAPLAWAQASLVTGLGGPQGFGENTLHVNDDGYSTGIGLSGLFPYGLNYFGTTHSTVYVNNNGNLTFSGGVGTYTPLSFPISSQPMIAPYWGDVDTRGGQPSGCTGCNLIYWDLDVFAGQFTATWYNVGYYSSATNRLNSFQAVLTDRSPSFGPGDFDIQFRYNRCEWTTGNASGGSNGLGGTEAQMGFDAGNLSDFWSHPDSQTPSILSLCTTSNVGIPGVWEFEVRNGALFECGNGVIEGSEVCDDGNVIPYDGCYNCVPEIDADGDTWYDGEDCDDADANNYPGNLEVCDGQDNDCDVQIDEGFDVDLDGFANCMGDCDDYNASIYPGAVELCDGYDNDCNGLVDDGHDVDGDGWTTCMGDCDDLIATVYPGALEHCNGLDDDCNGVIDEGHDLDADGWATCMGDCDDSNDSVYPGAVEVCDGYDNDCNGLIDDGYDVDADGWTTCMGDCDDLVATVYPGAPELCNDMDDDCNGLIDEGHDSDGDGWLLCDGDCDDTNASVYPGAPEVPYDGIDQDCDGQDLNDLDGDGYIGTPAGGQDCDDTDAAVYPGAVEGPDGVDNDCDGVVDELTEFYDDDGDGYTELGGDCDDSNPLAHPAATESCDSVDQDCDGLVDEETECSDDDEDGFSELDGDCNDADELVHPGQQEIPDNGVDDDCDGSVDGGESDPDFDGYTISGGDCVENDSSSHPGAQEVCDAVDNDCDGDVDEDTECADDDGDGVSELDGDCNDANDQMHPAAVEGANGVDDDCDGTVDEGTDLYDDDGDGVTELGGDCDDSDEDIHPGAIESLNGVDDDCDGDEDELLEDLDQDGWTTDEGDCDDINGWIHPEAPEMCDELDNDCNEEVDDGCADLEGDLPELSLGDGCSCGVVSDARPKNVGRSSLVALLLGSLLVLRRRRCWRPLAGGSPGGFALLLMGLLATQSVGCSGESSLSAVEAGFGIEPHFVDLGVTPVDELRTATFYLQHSFGGPINVLSVEVENHEHEFFSLSGEEEFQLGRDVSEQLDIHYLPTDEGYHWAKVTLVTDGTPREFELVVRGRAAEPKASITPFSLDFGPVEEGHEEERSVWLGNEGPVPITVVGATTDEEAFELVDSLPIVVEPGVLERLVVRFTAEDDDPAYGELDLSFAGDLFVQDVALRANDCEAGDPAAYDQDDDGYTTCAGDCDDDDPLVWPGHPELPDGVDNNCDGRIDDGTELYDDDGDGFAEVDGDCNDADEQVRPGGEEVEENGVDDDCDGIIDHGLLDGDGDGYTMLAGDCDDADITSFPGASEQPDAVDNDCDGVVDEGTSLYDDDLDGFTEAAGDCDDSRPQVYPGAVEAEDWMDNDCDGLVDEGTNHSDDDGDGYSEMGGDCDDSDPSIGPPSLEVLGNGVDDDCDGEVD